MFESWSIPDDEITDDHLRSLADGFFEPDVTYEEDPAWPGASTFTGWRAVTDQLLEYREVLGRGKATIETLVNAGEGRWAAAVRIAGESASGAPWDHVWGYSFEMRHGRINRFRAYFDVARPFQELGLPAVVPQAGG
jgi:ketosteroid isomerase-like protein